MFILLCQDIFVFKFNVKLIIRQKSRGTSFQRTLFKIKMQAFHKASQIKMILLIIDLSPFAWSSIYYSLINYTVHFPYFLKSPHYYMGIYGQWTVSSYEIEPLLFLGHSGNQKCYTGSVFTVSTNYGFVITRGTRCLGGHLEHFFWKYWNWNTRYFRKIEWNLLPILEKIGDHIECPIKSSDIDVVFRPAPNISSINTKPIIAKLTGKQKRDAALSSARKTRKGFNTKEKPGLCIENI